MGGRVGFSTVDSLLLWNQFIRSNRASLTDPTFKALDIQDFFGTTNLNYTREMLSSLGIDSHLIDTVLRHVKAMRGSNQPASIMQGSPISGPLACGTLGYILMKRMGRVPQGMMISLYIDDLMMISFCHDSTTENYLQSLEAALAYGGWSFNHSKTETIGPGIVHQGVNSLGWVLSYTHTVVRRWVKLRISAPRHWLGFQEIKAEYKKGNLLKAASILFGRAKYQQYSENIKLRLYKSFRFYLSRLYGYNSTERTRNKAYYWLRKVLRRIFKLPTTRHEPRIYSIFNSNS